MKLARETILGILLAIALVNFAVFLISVWIIGGEALSGKIEGGVYFVGYRQKFTAVSPAVWWYSLIQTCSTIATHAVAIIGAWLLYRGKKLFSATH